MHTPICDELSIEFPIFAFTHCRDVVVAVSKAGGFGVLGAVGFTPEQLEIELKLDRRAHRRPPLRRRHRHPEQVRGHGLRHCPPRSSRRCCSDMVPQEHLDFARKILADHGVPIDHSDDDALQLLGWTEATATPQVEVALQHPKVTLIANALGTPPADMIKHIHDEGPQGRGAVRIAVPGAQARRRRRRHHHRPGRRGRRALRRGRLDRAVAAGRQGGRARSRCWPPAASAAAQQIAAALALGAQGAWTGSQWVWSRSPRTPPFSTPPTPRPAASDTVRSRSFTGKPARMLRNDWTEAWEDPDNPKPLGMPLQYMVSGMAVAATHKYPNESVDVAFNPIGQVVGQFTKVEKTSAVIERWVQEYLEATNTLNEINEAASI